VKIIITIEGKANFNSEKKLNSLDIEFFIVITSMQLISYSKLDKLTAIAYTNV